MNIDIIIFSTMTIFLLTPIFIPYSKWFWLIMGAISFFLVYEWLNSYYFISQTSNKYSAGHALGDFLLGTATTLFFLGILVRIITYFIKRNKDNENT